MIETIWLAKYTDHMYPEELELARSINPNHPDMNTKKEWYYSTEQICFINL